MLLVLKKILKDVLNIISINIININ